jgi:hypothetical protein
MMSKMSHRFEKRRHCLVGKYVDVLHMEMLNLLLEEEELPSSCRFGGVPRPMQASAFTFAHGFFVGLANLKMFLRRSLNFPTFIKEFSNFT